MPRRDPPGRACPCLASLGPGWAFVRASGDAIAPEHEGGALLVASVSAWELAIPVTRGHLALSLGIGEWRAPLSQTPAPRFVPADNDLAIASVTRPGDFHEDPADRLIITTAQAWGTSRHGRREDPRIPRGEPTGPLRRPPARTGFARATPLKRYANPVRDQRCIIIERIGGMWWYICTSLCH